MQAVMASAAAPNSNAVLMLMISLPWSVPPRLRPRSFCELLACPGTRTHGIDGGCDGSLKAGIGHRLGFKFASIVHSPIRFAMWGQRICGGTNPPPEGGARRVGPVRYA